MVAIGLLLGDLRAEHYDDEAAMDWRIDQLREKMHVIENKQFSQDYHDPDKRSIANSIKLVFDDGTESEQITIEYPIGHRRRREEGVPVLLHKFKQNLSTRFSSERVNAIIHAMNDTDTFASMSVVNFMECFI